MGVAALPLSVRTAEASDAERVVALLHELGYRVAVEHVAQRLAAFRGSQSDHVLLATADEQIAGLISVSITPLLVEGAAARITALVVDERHRRKGVGRALITEAEGIAKAAKCGVIQVSSGNRTERTAAHKFYSRLGYTDAATHHTLYERPLEQPAL